MIKKYNYINIIVLLCIKTIPNNTATYVFLKIKQYQIGLINLQKTLESESGKESASDSENESKSDSSSSGSNTGSGSGSERWVLKSTLYNSFLSESPKHGKLVFVLFHTCLNFFIIIIVIF